MFSKFTNILEVSKTILKLRFMWKNPIYLIHSLTSKCNARCGFCAWNPDFYQGGDELSTEEIKKLYLDAHLAGFKALSIWGGEPLIHKDVSTVIEYAHELGFLTSIVTNGALLERKMKDVVPHLDRIGISLDHPSDKHDEMRKVKNLFNKIIQATEKIQRKYPKKKVIFNYTLQKDNIDSKTIKEMIYLLKSLKVGGIFNAMRLEPAADETDSVIDNFNPSQENLQEVFGLLYTLKKQGAPIINSYTHLNKMRNGIPEYHCHWPKLFLPIEANGDVVDCQHWGVKTIGNIKETDFSELLKSQRLYDLTHEVGEKCHKCVSVHRIEVSEAWAGKIEPLRSWSKSLA